MNELEKECIVIVNAAENNLQNVSLNIPKKKLIVVTGVSGSGKSSLIFDTLAAESRRELNETFPSFVQHYLPKYGRPHVDVIKNLPVTIIVDQKKLGDNVRSTVGTYTDVYTFLRLLFSRVGKPFIGYSDVFSFNHPGGMCPKCGGLGVYTHLHIEKMVDFNRSLNEDAINFPTFHYNCWRWKRYAYSGLFDLDKKIKDYSPEEMDLFLNSPQIRLKNPPEEWPRTAKFEGLIPRMYRSIISTDESKMHAKHLARLVTSETCPQCCGSRVNEKVESCKINGRSIADVALMPLDEVLEFIDNIDDPLAVDIQSELRKRIGSLLEIGLGYLSLSRGASTLSGGEAQRIKIAKHINGALSDILYVLDEPSAGLHLADISRLKKSLARLKGEGNTIIIVEHNPALIRLAEHVIDLGPRAGENGGRVMYAGDLEGLLQADTITSHDLRETIPFKSEPRQPQEWLAIENASYHNLKNVSLRAPLGVLTVLCGVAGAGKSSLTEVIMRTLDQPAVHISQKGIGISLRSTPATYLDISDEIRKLFARANKVAAAYFSFNSKGGCPVCQGKGVIVTDMSFMEDIVTTCEKCGGARYNDEVLGYQYRGKNIAQVMGLSVAEARRFFESGLIHEQLSLLEKVGLDYLRLNQSLSTLSGGELQRLKLASHLDEKGAVYLLDEPTTGLHMEDVKKLIALFDDLVARGNSVIISEHNLAVIKRADWIIELGPGGGNKGGQIVFAGTPQQLAQFKDSVTGPYLRA